MCINCTISFREHHQRMSTLMGGFNDPFLRFHQRSGLPSALPAPGVGGQHHRSSLRNQQVATRDMFGGGMFGDMFASMNTMMANMQRNFVSEVIKSATIFTCLTCEFSFPKDFCYAFSSVLTICSSNFSKVYRSPNLKYLSLSFFATNSAEKEAEPTTSN